MDCKYNTVDDKYTVKDENLARKYLESTLLDFRTYTIGTFFALNRRSSKVQFADDNKGIWIL